MTIEEIFNQMVNANSPGAHHKTTATVIAYAKTVFQMLVPPDTFLMLKLGDSELYINWVARYAVLLAQQEQPKLFHHLLDHDSNHKIDLFCLRILKERKLMEEQLGPIREKPLVEPEKNDNH